MEYTAVLAKQSMLYNQFRYLCEMRDLFNEDGFDSTVWTANLWMGWARTKTAKLPWEASDVWKVELPLRFKSPDVSRFMRLLQSLNIPKVPAMT
jgi:hypothetical protein